MKTKPAVLENVQLAFFIHIKIFKSFTACIRILFPEKML